MTELQATKTALSSSAKTAVGRLFVLELSGDRIHSMNLDGSDRKTIVTDCHLPDGIVVDAKAGHIYWTNMGVPNLDDGSIERADLDGSGIAESLSRKASHTRRNKSTSIRTATQTLLVRPRGHAGDAREPRRLARRNAGRDRPRRQGSARSRPDGALGITIDPKLGKIYWTQKGPTKGGLRPSLLPRQYRHCQRRGARRTAPTSRCCLISCRNPSISSSIWRTRVLYWTDRGDPPRGNTVNRAPIDKKCVCRRS